MVATMSAAWVKAAATCIETHHRHSVQPRTSPTLGTGFGYCAPSMLRLGGAIGNSCLQAIRPRPRKTPSARNLPPLLARTKKDRDDESKLEHFKLLACRAFLPENSSLMAIENDFLNGTPQNLHQRRPRRRRPRPAAHAPPSPPKPPNHY